MFISYRGINIRDSVNSYTVQNLDDVKSESGLSTGRSISIMPKFLCGRPSIQRRSYSSSLDVIKRLEDKKRELEEILTPELRGNMEKYKQDSNTV